MPVLNNVKHVKPQISIKIIQKSFQNTLRVSQKLLLIYFTVQQKPVYKIFTFHYSSFSHLLFSPSFSQLVTLLDSSLAYYYESKTRKGLLKIMEEFCPPGSIIETKFPVCFWITTSSLLIFP